MNYVVECRPDEALMSLLLPTRQHVIHRSGKPEVLKFVKKTEGTLGMIDEDPSSIQPPLLGQLQEVESSSHLGLKLSKFSAARLVVTLSPRLEEWVLDECRRMGVPLTRYNLPSDSEAFHDIVNQRLDNFSRLISDLKNNRSERLQKLSDWLQPTRYSSAD